MNDRNILSLGFLDREPKSAADALENLEPHEVAIFLDRVPTRLAEPVVRFMAPWSAARCLEQMHSEAAVALLTEMPHVDAISVLRLVDREVRETILGLSPAKFARTFRQAMNYRRDTVGAWMDMSVPSFEASRSVESALRGLRRGRHAQSHLFLVDATHRYIGVVSVADLLRFDGRTLLNELIDQSVGPILSHAPLAQCSRNRTWDLLNVLPVVGRKQNLLGGLSRSDLRKGLAEPFVTETVFGRRTIVELLGLAFLAVASEFAKLNLMTRDVQKLAQTEDRVDGS